MYTFRFFYKPSFTILYSSLKSGGLFFQKKLPKKVLMGEILGENLWGRGH